MVVAILTFTNYFVMGVLVSLSFVVYIEIGVKASSKTFFGCIQGLNLLVGSLQFKFD